MKITIWIRPSDSASGDETPTLRLDYKNENCDTPQISRYGRKLMDAIEGKNEKENNK